jgi:hypothetical protein
MRDRPRTGPALLLAFLLALPGAAAAQGQPSPRHAQFGAEPVSREARHVADWAVRSADPRGMPFIIVDKVHSKVFVFDGVGRLLGAASALLGSARGDESVAGIGQRKLSTILAQERTTPAGRFEASLAKSPQGEEILWVDYDSALALHRVIATVPKERRLQRLAGHEPQARRITYGCINVPVRFYEDVVSPAFKATSGIVYVLPEQRSLREVFGAYGLS